MIDPSLTCRQRSLTQNHLPLLISFMAGESCLPHPLDDPEELVDLSYISDRDMRKQVDIHS